MSLATFATNFTIITKQTTASNQPKLKTFEKWIKKRQKPACLRIPHLTPTNGDEYYYGLLMLFKPFRNEADLMQPGESSRDAFQRQIDSLDMHSSPYLHMAQEIQQAIIRIRLQDAQTPLDIAAQVAPNLSSLETTQQDLQDHHETDLEWLQINATMLANTSIDQTQHHITSEQAQNSADESLSWTQASITTMTDTQYYQNLNRASADQRLVIDRVYRHNRSLIQGHNFLTSYYCL